MHAPIKFDWLGVIIGYPYTHSIPHPPPIVNYFFKKNYLSSKKKTRVTHAERNPCSMDDRLGFPPDLLLVYHRRSPLSTPMAKKKQKKKRELNHASQCTTSTGQQWHSHVCTWAQFVATCCSSLVSLSYISISAGLLLLYHTRLTLSRIKTPKIDFLQNKKAGERK